MYFQTPRTIMIKCIAIDNELLALKQIESYIDKSPFLEKLAIYTSPEKAIDVLQEKQVDLMFIDIDMPDLNGIDFVKLLDNPPMVIFTSVNSQHAIDGFRLNAIDYLLKPLNYSEFLKSAHKAKARFKIHQPITSPDKTENNFLFIKSNYKTIKIDLNHIKYIESISEYMKIHLDNSTEVMSLCSLKSIEDKLPDYKFMRIHRSYIVNLTKISVIDRNRIIFDDKIYISVSEKYKSKFQNWVNENILV